MEKLAERITALRKASGLSQLELAKAIGVSRVSIGFYERGERIPPVNIALNIAQTLHVSINYLLGAEQKAELCLDEAIKIIKEEIEKHEGSSAEEHNAKLWPFTFDAVRILLAGYGAAVDTVDKLLKQSDVDGTDCCWACMWSGLDRGCGGRTPKWRGLMSSGEVSP